MEPIRYLTGGESPMQAFKGALTLGTDIQQQRAASLAAEAEANRQAEIQARFARLSQPGATTKDYMDLAMILPKDQSEALRESFKVLKADEQQAALTDTAQVFSAFKAARPDLAVQLIRQHATAEKAAGNEQGAQLAEEWAKMVEASPEGASAVENMFGYTLAQMPGGDKALEGTLSYAKDLRLQQEHPILMAQKKAELAKVQSDAEKADIEAKYAEKVKLAGLETAARELGLTDAKAAEALAHARWYDNETLINMLKFDAAKEKGGLGPEQVAQLEDSMRKEWWNDTTNFRTIQHQHDIVKSAEKSGIGDVALIFAIMKMYDPASVVREGEQATAQNAAGVPSSLIGVYNQLIGGGKLGDAARTQIKDQAEKIYKTSLTRNDALRTSLVDIAKRRGLNMNNIITGGIDEGTTTEVDY